MRAFMERVLSCTLVAAALLWDGAAAQSNSAPGSAAEETLEAAAADALIADAAGATEPPDEVTVRGRQDAIGEYRLEMVKAREGLVETFNELNDDEGNEITCKNESATGTRMTQNVCRSKAENDASARAAKGFLDGLLRNAGRYMGPGTVAQVNGQINTANSQREGLSGEAKAREQLEGELRKLMGENRQFYRAVVKYVEAKNDYNEARGHGDIVETDPLPEGPR